MWFDTHAHLDQAEFDADRAEVMDRARAAGLSGLLAVGVTLESSRATLRLAEQFPDVWAAVGLHPNYCGQAAPEDWDQIVAQSEHPRARALGETGLDRHWDYTPFEIQQDYFDRHLRLSQATGLPIVIHTRDCEAEMRAMLREARQRGPLVGIMHSFSLSAEAAAECLELGLHLSFAGMLTYKKSQALREIAAGVPGERLLVETDSPYLPPHPKRGTRNEPANLVLTGGVLAEVCGVPQEEMAARTTANARRLFKIAEH